MTQEKFTFFWSGPFSQWYSCGFIVDDMSFNCAEQYMMYRKAMLFNDVETAKKIMASRSPRQQKSLGRTVKPFDPNKWNESARGIVFTGNYAKFSQNPLLLEALLITKGTTLVEASPYDTVWGIGLKADDPLALDRRTWRGTNWLGEVLTSVREKLA